MRNMSFSLTKKQFLDGSKDVTRRIGWEFIKAGDIVCAIEKGMGLRKGEKVNRLGQIEIISTRWESLVEGVNQEECRREGFPDLTPGQFVAMFCKEMKCNPYTLVNRIEFKRI